MQSAAEVLGPDGPLGGLLDGFVPRTCQQEMAERIEAALADSLTFVAESGTGTGKTFAYLVPALLSGKKVLVSTGTKNLQDQLYHRDLPLIRRALHVPVTTALLKGRANYLCLYRLEVAELEHRFSNRAHAELERVRKWAGKTRTGDVGEVASVPDHSEVWPQVTSTTDNCLGVKCDHYDRCHVNRARREALAADVLVINHHLFFADLVLREDGFGKLLPGADAVIFDEAHQLPEVASAFLGMAVSGAQLNGLCRDTVAAELQEHSAVKGLQDAAHNLEKASADFRLSLGRESRRAAWDTVAGNPRVRDALDHLHVSLGALNALLEPAAAKGEALTNCWRRALELEDRLGAVSGPPSSEYVQWFETTARGFTLRLTPIDTAGPFRQSIAGQTRAWIFTSATLAIDHSFAHFQSQLGLEDAETGFWDSPFDFAHNALLYLPNNMPAPSAPDYTARVVARALPVLTASGGRAFMLFTSHRALREAAELLADHPEFNLLVQGQGSRRELVERFVEQERAVLLGTSSFWEGVDVRGEALSCVIIDKLPFASPADPVLQARGKAMEAAGRNPFMEYQLPNAVIALKQGVGRLIRDVNDRGVLMICDPRLRGRGYGKAFTHSLPPMPVTVSVDDAVAFFA